MKNCFDTNVRKWYDIMYPHFCDAVEHTTSLSNKADDLNSANESEKENTGFYSDVSSEDSSDVKSSKQPCLVMASSSVESEEEGNVISVQSSSSQGGAEPKKVDAGQDVKKGKKQGKGESPKKSTKIKLHSKRNSKPRPQSHAMIQVVKSIENSCTKQQEENKDVRLQTLLASEQKRDEMFYAYQRAQAEANRKHEMMMAQILL